MGGDVSGVGEEMWRGGVQGEGGEVSQTHGEKVRFFMGFVIKINRKEKEKPNNVI